MCQTKYFNELLKRLGMEDAKSIETLMPTNGKFEKDENGKDVDVNKYRGMIESPLPTFLCWKRRCCIWACL